MLAGMTLAFNIMLLFSHLMSAVQRLQRRMSDLLRIANCDNNKIKLNVFM